MSTIYTSRAHLASAHGSGHARRCGGLSRSRAEFSDYRTNSSLVDLSVRVATSILDWIPTTAMQMLYEYWNVDFTFAQTPEASSFANAFGQEAGVANSQDRFVVDQR